MYLEEFAFGFVYLIINVIGGSIRWVYGSIWRTLLKKDKFTYQEYIYGPKKSKNYYDKFHTFNNGLVAIIF